MNLRFEAWLLLAKETHVALMGSPDEEVTLRVHPSCAAEARALMGPRTPAGSFLRLKPDPRLQPTEVLLSVAQPRRRSIAGALWRGHGG